MYSHTKHTDVWFKSGLKIILLPMGLLKLGDNTSNN